MTTKTAARGAAHRRGARWIAATTTVVPSVARRLVRETASVVKRVVPVAVVRRRMPVAVTSVARAVVRPPAWRSVVPVAVVRRRMPVAVTSVVRVVVRPPAWRNVVPDRVVLRAADSNVAAKSAVPSGVRLRVANEVVAVRPAVANMNVASALSHPAIA